MIKEIKRLKFLRPYVPYPVIERLKRISDKRKLAEWEQKGCPVPPPHPVKQAAIAEYQQKSGITIFVETGTFRGDMVEAQRKNFKQIFSIELGDELFRKAKKRFRNYGHISIIHGDSGTMLPKVLNQLNAPAIFWLDGHYSQGITAKGKTECPIFEELDAIFSGSLQNHIILIDDARCFNGKDDYPSVGEITEYIKSKNVQFRTEVRYDIIRYEIMNSH